MRKLFFLSLILFFCSCEYFKSTQDHTQQLVNEELLAIDWNDVDQYPLFDSCDETAEKPVQFTCFQEQMHRHMVDTLEGLEYEVPTDMNDTVNIDLMIDEHGFITVLDVKHSGQVGELLPTFNDEVTQRLNDVTTVAPALKRGIPVSIKFRLPIILNTQH